MLRNIFSLIIVMTLISSCDNGSSNKNDNELKAYVGTYTRNEGHVNGKAEGIIAIKMNKKDGKLSLDKTVAKLINPSFINKSPNGKFIFAVSELGPNDPKQGEVYSYEILRNDSLKQLDINSTDAYAPCHITSNDTHVFIANYLNGVAKLIAYDEDGKFGKSDTIILKGSSTHPQQTSSLLHHINISKSGEKIYITDKGSDKIWMIDIDKVNSKFIKSSLDAIDIQAGAGPRHLEFTPNYKFAYTMNELDNMVNCFSVDKDNKLRRVGKITALPLEFKGESYGAEIKIHKSGKFLYVSNRGHNSIAAFKINQKNGHLTLIDYYDSKGEFPRSFEIDPSGKFLYVANQNSDNIVQFNINKKNGELTFSGNILEISTPVDIQF